MPDATTLLENRVRFTETDLHGHVFFGEFFTYLDETFNAYLREIGYPYDRMHAEGWTTNVVHAELDYHAPAAYEDVVRNRMRIDSIDERSLTAIYEAEVEGEPVASGEVVHVAVGFGDGGSESDDDAGDRGDGDDGEVGAAVRVPDAFREAVAAFHGDPS